jgi:hypothetical protein
MSVSAVFDTTFYLTNNADVVVGISQGNFTSALQHFTLFGGKELRAPNSTFDPNYYAINNSDVLNAVSAGTFSNVFAHYQEFGEVENRAPTLAFASFDSAGYLAANTDVAAAVTAGTFTSALDHFISFGQTESRSGSGITAVTNPGTAFTLTTASDTITGTSADDTLGAALTLTNGAIATTSTLNTADTADLGAGADTVNITVDGDFANNTDFSLSAFSTANAETVNIRAVVTADGTGDTITVDGANFAGHTSLNADRSSSGVTFENVAVGASIGIKGNGSTTNGATTATYATTATAAAFNYSGGTIGTGAVNFIAAGATSLAITSTGAANVTGAVATTSTGITAVTIDAASNLTATSLAIGTNAGTQSLTITGAGNASIGAIDDDFASTDASGATGNVTATLNGTVAATFTGGTGNDVVTTSTNAQTGAVNAGDGTDVLVVGATAHVNTTAEGGVYTNFETVRSADSVNLALLSGITALQITGGTSETYSGVTDTIASNVTFSGNNAISTIFTGSNVTGASDAITINLTSGTAATNVDVIGLSVAGYETVNLNATTGTNGTLSDFGFLANSADNVSTVTITGAADVQLNAVANTFDTRAVAVDASGLTGTGHFVLATGVLFAGSSVVGSANADTVAISSVTGSTYTLAGGDDRMTGSVADLVATGATDNIINGGDGDDRITLDDAAVTLTDNHFTQLSSIEELTLATGTSTGDVSITTGGSFNAAFANGAVITNAGAANTSELVYGMGLSNVDTTVAITSAGLLDATNENLSVTTGSGADTVTIAAAAMVGVAAAASSKMTINTAAGNDAITFSYSTLVSNNTAGGIAIDAGTGKDTINKTAGTNAANAFGITTYTVADGDSLAASYDEITGFDLGTGAIFADSLDFAGTGVTGNTAGTNGTDSGTIKSHAITSGIITFDDTDSFGTAVTINSANLADALAYVATNISTASDTVAFAYDSTNNGTANGTFVFQQGTNDSVVLLTDVVGTSVSATNAAVAGLIDIG